MEKELIFYENSDKSEFSLNWNVDLIWDREDYPDLPYAEVIEGTYELMEMILDSIFLKTNLTTEKEFLMLRELYTTTLLLMLLKL